jgi:hypothetical protein
MILQGAEEGIDRVILRAGQIGVGKAAAASAVADQIVALALQGAADIRERRSGIRRDKAVAKRRSSSRAGFVDAAAGLRGGVAAQGGVGNRDRTVLEDSAVLSMATSPVVNVIEPVSPG